jgi:hypothetical protein
MIHLHESKGEQIDASGKLFELHTMRHLLGGAHAQHYRDDELGHPEAAAETLRKRVTPEDHDTVVKSSAAAADRIKDHIQANHPGFKVHKVTWTSNKRDIQRFHDEHKTGGTQSDQDNADYVVSIKHPKTGEVRHVGISSKYTADPTARSPGLTALSTMSKVDHEHTKNIIDDHDKKINKIMGFKGESSAAKVEAFRKVNASGSKQEKENKRLADDVGRARGVTLAQHFHQAFSSIHPKNPNARNEHMRGVLSVLSGSGGERSVPTITLGTDKKKVPSIKDDSTSVDEKLGKMKSFHTKPTGNNLHFYGIHKDTGEEVHFGKLELRSKSVNSSPHIPLQGFRVGSFLKGKKKTST